MEPLLQIENYNQLKSINGCRYYLREKQKFFECSDTNKIDTNLRVLTNLLLHHECKIHVCSLLDMFDDEKSEKMYDTYVQEQKQIQENGIVLYYWDSTEFFYKQDDYKLCYPNKKFFANAYAKHHDYGFITFQVNNTEKINILIENSSKFDNALLFKDGENKYFELYFRYSHRDVVVGMFRRYAQIFSDLFVRSQKNEHV